MKRFHLIPLLLTLTSGLHAGVGLDLNFLEEFSFGEAGRPKVTPQFETWGITTAKGISRDPVKQGNLTLSQLDGTAIKLSSLWADKPVLLVHGSLTCPISRDNCPHVDQIQARFGDQINVVILYTTEAHPVGSPSPYSEGGHSQWLTDRNINEDFLGNQPKTLEARLLRAKNYRDRVKIKSRVVVDSMDNDVWKFFGAGSNTAIFIAKGGHVIHRQGWFKPSLMPGKIRAHHAQIQRAQIQPSLKGTALEKGHSKLTATQLEKIARQVPEVVQYHLSNKGAVSDQTLLHLSVSDLKLDLTKKLLALKAPPNSQDQDGLTPLHYALHLEVPMTEKEPYLTLLLDHGASDQILTDQLESAMHFAVQSRSLETVQFVAQKDFEKNVYSIDGISPLHEALFQGDLKIARYLLSQGIAEDIFTAAALGDIELVKLFITFSPNSWTSLQGQSGRSPLIYAAIGGHLEMIEFLLSRQTDDLKYPHHQFIAALKESKTHGNIKAGKLIAQQTPPLEVKNSPPPIHSFFPQLPPGEAIQNPIQSTALPQIPPSQSPETLKRAN